MGLLMYTIPLSLMFVSLYFLKFRFPVPPLCVGQWYCGDADTHCTSQYSSKLQWQTARGVSLIQILGKYKAKDRMEAGVSSC